ncbi:MAG: hypothetical protein Q8Q54_15745, partial [Methylococcales bacterium]|nr:hypothetical protein [Methylococcales bacterium]
MKTFTHKTLSIAIGLVAMLAIGGSVLAAGQSGTTLAGYKTIDICEVTPASSTVPAVWRYSGEISVWNEGAINTIGLKITDFIEYKTGNKWVKGYNMPVTPSDFGEITAGTTQETATVFRYTYEDDALPGTIRNNASITIMNHSGNLNKPFGPNPKATFFGVVLPCPKDIGCTYTIGYWGAKPGVIWPSDYDRNATFYSSPYTWGDILPNINEGGNSNGYYQLARQYIGAVLNQANGAPVPSGVQDTLDEAKTFFKTKTPADCPSASSCGRQKT